MFISVAISLINEIVSCKCFSIKRRNARTHTYSNSTTDKCTSMQVCILCIESRVRDFRSNTFLARSPQKSRTNFAKLGKCISSFLQETQYLELELSFKIFLSPYDTFDNFKAIFLHIYIPVQKF